ncbi:MAG: signal peptide peptidase [Candidatus Angelobacter sp.]|jgi:protease-4|nr:signal peptide peptidase [Candidatus Angelobacter sp.]
MPENENRSRTLLWVVIGGGAFFLFVMAVFTVVYFAVKADHKTEFASGFGDKIAVVDVEGVLIDSKQFIKDLKRYDDDDSVKAIIVRINSPGGGVAASQEMYQAVRRIRDRKKKPIVSSISTVGASGAYYVAVGTSKIFADTGSIVGSIGVIAQWYNYGDLLRWAKLKDVTLKAGELKDTGNPARDMTPAERAYMQGIIDDMHGQFIHDVAEGRKMKDDDLKPLASGRVWTGQQALPLKLIDQLGDFQATVDDTAKSVGIKGEPTLVRPEKDKRTLADILFGDISDLIPDRTKMMQSNIGFYYLWR